MSEGKVTCVILLGGNRGLNDPVLPALPVGSSQVLKSLQGVLSWAKQGGHPVFPSLLLKPENGLIMNPVVGRILLVGLMAPDFRPLIEHLSRQVVPHQYVVITGACAWNVYDPLQLQDDLVALRLSHIVKVVETLDEARSLPQLVSV